MYIYSNNNKNIVKKVNPYLINKQEDTVISWQEQVKLYSKGIIPKNLPLVVLPTMNSNNIEGLSAKPVFIYFDTIEKKQLKHDLSDDFIYGLDKFLSNWIIGFDSVQKETSKVFVLGQKDRNDSNIVVIVSDNEKIGFYSINLITSFYGKDNLQALINRTFKANKEFYLNPLQIDKINTLGISLPFTVVEQINEVQNKHAKSLEDFGLGM